MAPPPAIGAMAASVRITGGTLLSGVPLLLLAAWPAGTLTADRPSVASPVDAFLHCSASYLLLLSAAALALCYLGSVRATITHQEGRKLALQTCALAFPCVVIARAVGSALLREAAGVA